MTQVMANSYLWQKYDSPRCCKTAKEAFDVFNDLNSKSTKLQFVKEQILLRYLGLGWTKAYHPLLKNKYVYSPSELMEHFVKVVLPLQNTEVVPEAPLMNLPGLAKYPHIWTGHTKLCPSVTEWSLTYIQAANLPGYYETRTNTTIHITNSHNFSNILSTMRVFLVHLV